MALLTDILAYWNLNDNGSGGVSLVDSTGNGYTLTNTDVTLGTGIIGGDGVFNGSSSVLENASLSVGSGNFSLSVWINPSSTNSSGIINQGNDDDQVSYVLSYVNEQVWFYGANNEQISPCGSTPIGNWSHVCLTNNSGLFTIYVNGSSVGSTSLTADFSGAPFKIGLGYGGIAYFNGGIDEIGVWSRALSGAEITELYNSGAGLTYPFNFLYFSGGNLSSLSNWWQNDGFTIPAVSLPNSNTGVVINQNATSGSLVCQSANINNASNAGSITGVCTFNGTSSNSGSIVGNCTFNGSSSNTGSITGNASVYYPAQNPLGGSVSGTISYFWPNGTGIWGGDVWIDGENVLIIPAENEVKAGVVYGFPATPLTGTYSGGGAGSSSISISRLLNLPSFIKI